MKWSKKFKPRTLEQFARWNKMKHKKTAAERLGYAKAQITIAARIEKECTPEHHKEIATAKKYCPLCHRSVYGNNGLIPMPIEKRDEIIKKRLKI